MKKIYAPWRDMYVDSFNDDPKAYDKVNDCPFCTIHQSEDDQASFVLARSKHNAIIMNLYPYGKGHLLFIPKSHVGNLSDLSKETRSELFELATESTTILKKLVCADGFNMGFNLGKAAGAGIPAHVHMHLLPRWSGDTNFLPLIGNTKPISFDLEAVYKNLLPHFSHLNQNG